MRHAIVGVFVLIVALAALTPASAQNGVTELREWGVAVSVAWEERSVLVTGRDGYVLLYVEDSTDVRDAAGHPVALTALRVGQRVEYQAEQWKGMWFARSIAVARNVRASDR